MKKMNCLFVRDFSGKNPIITNQITEGCEWVIAGEGIATRKFDGTCCLVKDGNLFRRYDAKKGKAPPSNFIPAQLKPDPITNHWPGWVPIDKNDKYHIEAFEKGEFENGTYELCGPKVNSNPENLSEHILIKHGSEIIENCPRDFEGLREFLKNFPHEGIVFHRGNGEMVKLRVKDFE